MDEFSEIGDIISKRCCGKINEGIQYTSLQISTMTFCFNFNQHIDINSLNKNISPNLKVNYKPSYKKSRVPKKKGTDTFYNSFDIKFTIIDKGNDKGNEFETERTFEKKGNEFETERTFEKKGNEFETERTFEKKKIYSNISIFIFPNGKVKIAGIKTINTIKLILEELNDIIITAGGTDNTKELIAENIKIQMICSDFKIKPIKKDTDGWCIRQEVLKNILVDEYKLSATFSTLNRYPGINLKYKSINENNKPTSLLIFRSGCIIITGAKEIIDIVNSYEFIIDVVKKHENKLFYFDINEEIKQKKKKMK